MFKKILVALAIFVVAGNCADTFYGKIAGIAANVNGSELYVRMTGITTTLNGTTPKATGCGPGNEFIIRDASLSRTQFSLLSYAWAQGMKVAIVTGGGCDAANSWYAGNFALAYVNPAY